MRELFSSESIKEIKRVSAGIIILGVIMVIIFAFCKAFSTGVVLGALIGCAFAILNFVFLAYNVEKVLLMEDKKQAQNYMQSRHILRLIILAGMIIFAINVRFVNHWAAIIPLFFQRFIVYAIKFYDSKKGGKTIG